jgi:hypothetical protein
MMRTPIELIRQLDADAKKFSKVLLLIDVHGKRILIANEDGNRLPLLEDAIRDGGEPVGMIGIMINGDEWSFEKRVLAEDREWADRYLTDFLDEVERANVVHKREENNRNLIN